jgi:O-antigen ligase
MMNPIHKLGSGAGGSGVSGAAPYFMYVVAAVTVVVLGGILNTREKLVFFMRWSFRFALLVGIGFSVFAFIPATGPFFVSMGSFAAGNMGDGIQRFVQLPGYGLFVIQAALCPDLFRLTRTQSVVVFSLGMTMMVLGGNRSAVAAALIAIPVILLLRRKTHALLLSACLILIGVGVLRFSVAQMDMTQISPLTRSLGIFDSKIDEASGGDASAAWRYAVWQSGIDKIMENPLSGKGFGNLPERLDPNAKGSEGETDFEVVLAGGEAHNGFVTAAYGFGIPFMLGLTAVIFLRMFSHIRSALTTDKHDPELRDLHALLACMFATFPILIYTAFDMSVTMLWVYIGMGIILDHIPKSSFLTESLPVVQQRIQLPKGQPFKSLPSHSTR